MRSGGHILAAGMTMALLAGAVGCAGGGKIVAGQASLPADEGSPAFLDRLSSQQAVCENDALRGVLMLLDGEDAAPDFARRVEALRQRGVVAPEWDFDADRPLTRGRLAYMIQRAVKLPGGVVLTLAGPSQRYCLRELQYRRIITSGSLWGRVTGLEYVAVLARADAYLRTGQVPQVMLNPEPR